MNPKVEPRPLDAETLARLIDPAPWSNADPPAVPGAKAACQPSLETARRILASPEMQAHDAARWIEGAQAAYDVSGDGWWPLNPERRPVNPYLSEQP